MKNAILFVDADGAQLSGLQRMLRRQLERWEMAFVTTPQEALERLKQQNFDMVVSDTRMPALDGASLLSEVERRYPGTVRVILSGYGDEKLLLRNLGTAHQYIAKPYPAEALMALMERTRELRGILAAPALRRLAAGLRHLPSPPDLFCRLTAEIGRNESSTASVADMIGQDMAMTAELLKITNSSYFGLSMRVTTVAQAVRFLGLETVQTLILTTGIFKQYEGKRGLSQYLEKLNHYGLALGELARRAAKKNGADDVRQEQAFCAAMLSSIGALTLLDNSTRSYQTILAHTSPEALEKAEEAEFGASHCALGAYLLGLWGFTDPIVEAVLFQLNPSACKHTQKSALTYVHLAKTEGPQFPLFDAEKKAGFLQDRLYLQRCGWKD